MVELNHENFPRQQGYKIEIEKVDINTDLGQDEEGTTPAGRRLIQTNDMIVVVVEGDEGVEIPWHTHAPSTDEVIIPIEGAIRQSYISNEGEERSTVARPGEIVYLPPGAKNMVEHLESPTKWFMAMPRSGVDRIDHLLKDNTGEYNEEKIYDPNDLKHVGLDYDSRRGKVSYINEDAVSEY